MKALFHNKKGAVLPIRTSGKKQKGGLIVTILVIVAGVFLVMGSVGLYNKWIRPGLDNQGITSSLESGDDTITIEGSTTQYLDRPDAASFTFQVLDNANDDAVISGSVPLGALSQVVGDDGTTSLKEWLNPASADSGDTISSVPEDTVLSFYGGNGTYYLYPLTNRKIGVGDVVTLNGATIQTEANMVVTVYDDTGATALSAATNTTYHDYKLTLGEGQTDTVYLKLSNNAADKRFDLKAICTGAEGTNMSSLEVVGVDWSKQEVPVFIDNGQVTVTLDDATTTTAEYDRCYVYKSGTNEVIRLEEWDDTPLIKMTANAKTSKNPAADVMLFTAFDGAWKRGSDGQGHFDFYQHDSSEANIGLAETVDSPLGKQLGAIIELD